MNRQLTLATLLIFFSTTLFAQESWLWANRGGCSANNNKTFDEYPTAIEVDSSNNIYVCGILYSGSFPSTASFTGFGNRTLKGQNDLFIAKYDCSGAPLWLKTSNSRQSEMAYDMAMDDTQNIYIVGRGQHTPASPLVIEGDTIKSKSLLIAKYNGQGKKLWNYENDSLPFTFARAIEIGTNQTLYVLLEDWLIPNTVAPADIIPGHAAGANRYRVLALDTAGTPLWIKDLSRLTGSTPKMTIDKSNNLYFTGTYQDTFDFQGIQLYNHYPQDVSDCYIAKLDDKANLSWFKSYKDSNSLAFNDLMIHSDGDLHASWRYYYLYNDYKIWAGDTLLGWGSDTSIAIGSRSGIVKFQNQNISAQQSGTSSKNNLSLITLTEKPNGDIVLSGNTINDFSFVDGDTVKAKSQFFSPAMVMVDKNLNPYHQQELYGTDVASISVLGTDARGNIYAAGAFRDSVYFGPGLGLKSKGGKSDFFIAKWGVNSCKQNIGISETHTNKALGLYPNPASSYLQFEGENQPDLIQVYDLSGRLIFISKISADQQFEIPATPSGTYIVQSFKKGTFLGSEKVLIQ